MSFESLSQTALTSRVSEAARIWVSLNYGLNVKEINPLCSFLKKTYRVICGLGELRDGVCEHCWWICRARHDLDGQRTEMVTAAAHRFDYLINDDNQSGYGHTCFLKPCPLTLAAGHRPFHQFNWKLWHYTLLLTPYLMVYCIYHQLSISRSSLVLQYMRRYRYFHHLSLESCLNMA